MKPLFQKFASTLKRNLSLYFLIISIIFFVIIVIRNAWICDDAYITFRTIANFLHGDGLRFNLAERVQTYTHPLWMFLLSIIIFFTRNSYYSNIFLSTAFSLAAILVCVFAIARNRVMAIFFIITLICSKAFIDYSTSGLENPLSHFILAIYLLVFFKYPMSKSKLLFLTLIASFGTLNRMDLILLFLPVLVYSVWKLRTVSSFYTLALGFSPFFIWECFSLFYYGFPFPNTAYAKLNTGIPLLILLNQGFQYLWDSFTLDPLTLLTIIFIMVAVFFMKNWGMVPHMIGIIFYLIYTLCIGGDFMSGRFFVAPFFIAAICISYLRISHFRMLMIILVVLILGIFSPYSPLFNTKDYGKNKSLVSDRWGITDERAFYYPKLGLLNNYRLFPRAVIPWGGKNQEQREWPSIVSVVRLGWFPYSLNPETYAMDYFGLSSPLLSKLPVSSQLIWRIGHFPRDVPAGYIETLESNQSKILNKDLALFQEKLTLITRGKLFDINRLLEIIKMNFGVYNDLIEGINKSRHFYLMKPPLFARKLEINLSNYGRYLIVYSDYGRFSFNLSGNRIIAKQEIHAAFPMEKVIVLEIPSEAIEQGFNKIEIIQIEGSGNNQAEIRYLS